VIVAHTYKTIPLYDPLVHPFDTPRDVLGFETNIAQRVSLSEERTAVDKNESVELGLHLAA
jgi:hypothetical protein